MKVQVNIFLWGDHVNKVFDNIVIPLQKNINYGLCGWEFI